MNTYRQRFLEGRGPIVAAAVLYAALAGLLVVVIGTRTRGGLEILLTQVVSRALWVNFLLIAVAVFLCRRDLWTSLRHPGGEGRDRQTEPAALPGVATDGAAAGAPPACGRRGLALSRRWARSPGLWLLLIVIAGLLLVSQVAPRTHRIYYDEDIYANIGQNIALTGRTGMANFGTFEYGEYFVNWLLYNKDPAGWPFLISLAFQLFGTDEAWAFFLNNLLFAGAILVVFSIARLLTGRALAGLLAALVFALIPHNLIWSNTGAAETSAAFFGGLTVLCTLVMLRSRASRHLFLWAAVLPFACTLRPESALIGVWALVALLFNPDLDSQPLPERGCPDGGHAPHPLADRRFWFAGLLVFALLIPHLWHLWATSGNTWGAQGAMFSTLFFRKNLLTNGVYYVNNAAFPLVFTLLAAIGCASGYRGAGSAVGERRRPRPVMLILLWFVLFWGVFLFFYAGSYKYGADSRFALLSFMPLAVLAGLGAEALPGLRAGATGRGDSAPEWPQTRFAERSWAALLVLVLLLSWLKFLPLVRLVGQEAWGARSDHAYARQFVERIPTRSIVLTHIPTMFLLWGHNAVQAYAAVNNPELVRDWMKKYDGQVYFHFSYWCNTPSEGNRGLYEKILARYELEPVAAASEQTYRYGLYRMRFR